MKNTLLLKALAGQNHTGKPPVWLMRQAGRYLPEYRALRQRYSLLTMFRQPDLITEVTQLPIDKLGVDAAILYSDILILFDAMGVEWDVIPTEGPVVQTPLTMLPKVSLDPVHEKLHFALEGIARLKKSLDVPLIGFCGGPFTIASYWIEGRSSRDFAKVKRWLYGDPTSFSTLLAQIAARAADFVEAQIQAGADAIQIFDTWAGILTPAQVRTFILPSLAPIVDRVKQHGKPIILFGKGSAALAPLLAELRPTALSLDWQCDMTTMRQNFPNLVLQGNLDPCALYAAPAQLKGEIDRIVIPMQSDPSFIFNLGHGILPDVPVESAQYLVDYVHTLPP